VTDGQIDSETQDWLSQEHPDLLLLFIKEGSWQKLLQQSAVEQDKARFYLVDPRGFVMMYYSAAQTYKDVIADMKFLLKGAE
jgi:hypothetical protein